MQFRRRWTKVWTLGLPLAVGALLLIASLTSNIRFNRVPHGLSTEKVQLVERASDSGASSPTQTVTQGGLASNLSRIDHSAADVTPREVWDDELETLEQIHLAGKIREGYDYCRSLIASPIQKPEGYIRRLLGLRALKVGEYWDVVLEQIEAELL